MRYQYQLVFLGVLPSFIEDLKNIFFEHVGLLGIQREHFNIIDRANFDQYTDRNPVFCVYFGGESGADGKYQDESQVEKIVGHANFVLPVISENLDLFNHRVPEVLRKYNGMSIFGFLNDQSNIQKVVSTILEGFSLLRKSRRVFVSYKRSESTGVAIQLYEELEKHGFDVFLDTHSIRKSEVFQDELWHRMTDSDVVVLLSTPKFLESDWSREELAQASALSLGIVQLIWPAHKMVGEAQICIPISLEAQDFIGSYSSPDAKLSQQIMENVVYQVESVRARTLSARQDNLTSEFMMLSEKMNVNAVLGAFKFISVTKNAKDLIVVPTVGHPQSMTYSQSKELVKAIRKKDMEEIYILFDQVHIRDYWLSHLSWLNQYLPVKTLELQEVKEWLQKL